MKIELEDQPVIFDMIKQGECFNFVYENGDSAPYMKIRGDHRFYAVNLSNGFCVNVEHDTPVNPLNLMVTNCDEN